MTVMYDLNRRRAYIQAARLYASSQRWSSNLKELGALRSSDMYEALGIVGKTAGLKELLGNKNVNRRVRAAVRNILICYSNVVGTNAARTTERHVCNSYTQMWDSPCVYYCEFRGYNPAPDEAPV